MMDRLNGHEDWSTNVAPSMIGAAGRSSAAVDKMKGLAYKRGYLRVKKKNMFGGLNRFNTRYFVLQGATFMQYADEAAYAKSASNNSSDSDSNSAASGAGGSAGGKSEGIPLLLFGYEGKITQKLPPHV